MTREEVIDHLKTIGQYYSQDHSDPYEECEILTKYELDALYLAIKVLEQEPRKGHWISHREHCENLGVMPSGLGAYEWCSNCDCGIDIREWHRNNYNYCPNCGYRMVEPQESEDKE